MFKQYDYAQEIRLSNISSVLKREYNKNTKELQDVYRMKNKKSGLLISYKCIYPDILW